MLADGSGKIVWETKDRVYVPSLLARDGHLFGVLDAGVAACWKSDTGKEQWKKRLGGEFSASPVLVGDTIYATNESGETFVYRADPSKFEQIAVNKLGDQGHGEHDDLRQPHLHARGRASRRTAARNAVLPGEGKSKPDSGCSPCL